MMDFPPYLSLNEPKRLGKSAAWEDAFAAESRDLLTMFGKQQQLQFFRCAMELLAANYTVQQQNFHKQNDRGCSTVILAVAVDRKEPYTIKFEF